MKNILYVFGGEKAQGAEIVIERLMEYNAKNVHAHLIISPGEFATKLVNANKPYKIAALNDLKKLNRSHAKGFFFYFKATANYFKVSYKVYKYIKSNNIDIIHANTIVPATYLIPLILYAKTFMPKVKWIWSDHDIRYFSKIDHRLSHLVVRLYDVSLVVSEAVKRKYKSSKKAIVLYNGLDLEVFKPNEESRKRFREKLSFPEDAIVMGLAGKITPGKGQLELINVFNALSSKFPNVYLILAGGFAEDRAYYNEKVKDAINNNARIMYLGFLESITDYYSGADIIINNSNNTMSEALGTTIYEAMACEKIVVASATGGTPEIITDKVDGFLFETENQTELKKKFEYIISNYHSLHSLRIEARQKVKEKFGIQRMVQRYNEIISLN